MAIQAICSLESLSPLSFSKHYTTPPRGQKEGYDDYEKRTWRERLHYDEKGLIFVPPMAFKLSLGKAAQFLGMKIPGRRNATYTKHFVAGVLVLEGLYLGIHKEEVQGETLFVPADGRPGGSTRVEKVFPLIPKWKGEVCYYILDNTITKDAFETHIREAGNFIGIGRFRPERNGFYGRFKVTDLLWQVED